MFRFVIGKEKQGRDVFGGFFPNPLCLFIFPATEWSRMSAEPPFAHCPAPIQRQLSAGSGRANREQSCTLCMRPQNPTLPSLGSLKQLFPDLPGFKQGTVVPTRWHLQWGIKEAFSSYHSCNSCSFMGCPAGCSSQPHPTQHLQAEIKLPPFAGHFPPSGNPDFAPF